MLRNNSAALSLAALLVVLSSCDGEKPDGSAMATITTEPNTSEPAPNQPSDGNPEPNRPIDTIDLEERHQWEDRVILLFAENSRDPDYRAMASAHHRASA